MKKNFNRGQYGTKTISRRKLRKDSRDLLQKEVDTKIAEAIAKALKK